MQLITRAARTAFIGLLLSGVGFAFPFTFTGSGTGTGGNAVSAQATFAITGSAGNYQLVVTLTNTAPSVGNQMADFLSGVFFDISGNPTLTRVSAFANQVVNANGSVVPGTDISQHWSYVGGGGALQYGASQGIASAGLGPFNNSNLFNTVGANPNQPNGPDYTIIPNSGITNPSNGNTQNQPYVKYFATFTLGGLTTMPTAITNVTFQYGTAFNEGHLTGGCTTPGGCGGGGTGGNPVPEPTTIALLGGALVAAGVKMRKTLVNRA